LLRPRAECDQLEKEAALLREEIRLTDYVRQARIQLAQPGFQSRAIVVVTTLLDPHQMTKED